MAINTQAKALDAYDRCCELVLAHSTNQHARAYASKNTASFRGLIVDNPGLELSSLVYSQALYILSNIAQWRGDEAREVRSTLREVIAFFEI